VLRICLLFFISFDFTFFLSWAISIGLLRIAAFRKLRWGLRRIKKHCYLDCCSVAQLSFCNLLSESFVELGIIRADFARSETATIAWRVYQQYKNNIPTTRLAQDKKLENCNCSSGFST